MVELGSEHPEQLTSDKYKPTSNYPWTDWTNRHILFNEHRDFFTKNLSDLVILDGENRLYVFQVN